MTMKDFPNRKIFVSYRRDDDGAYLVPVLNQRLSNRYGINSVFYDIDKIPLGVDFRTYLSDAISEASIVLAVIGERWLGYDPKTGLRRIDKENDFVRVELEAALGRNIPVVPVLVGKAVMPSETELPPSISGLAYRNAAEVRTGKDYELHFAELERGLDVHFQAVGQRADLVAQGNNLSTSAPDVIAERTISNKGGGPVAATPKKPSAKEHIRSLFRSAGNRCTLADLSANGAYSLSNIKTCLSDLKNPKYAGGEVMIIETDGETYWKV